MQLADLQAKLQSRIENRCGTGPSVDSLEQPLNHARFELSRYMPQSKEHVFNLPVNETRVTLLDGNGDPEDVVYVEGVYIKDPVPSTPLGQTYGSIDDDDHDQSYEYFLNSGAGAYRELPSVYHMRERYRDLYQREVQFYRNFHELVIVRPGNFERVEGIVLYGAMQEWASIPDSLERYILDRAMAEFIDSHLVSEVGGLVRIPTPNGSFEFDGGRVLLSLRDKLIAGFEDYLDTRTAVITSG